MCINLKYILLRHLSHGCPISLCPKGIHSLIRVNSLINYLTIRTTLTHPIQMYARTEFATIDFSYKQKIFKTLLITSFCTRLPKCSHCGHPQLIKKSHLHQCSLPLLFIQQHLSFTAVS